MAAIPFSSEIEEISMDGFQVVSGDLFTRRSGYYSPTCTIWSGGITFNKVALTALNNCERVRIEIHPQKKSVLLVPVTMKDKDGIPWRKNIKDYAPPAHGMRQIFFEALRNVELGYRLCLQGGGARCDSRQQGHAPFRFQLSGAVERQRENIGEMNDIHISFYLRVGRIHIFTETLRLIGQPKRICFLISSDGQSLLMRAYETRDLKSHRAPPNVYNGKRSFEVSSCKLCGILANLHGWNPEYSYRVPGALMQDQRSVRFSLAEAEVIGKESF